MSNSVEQSLLQLYAELLSIPEDRIGFEESFIGLGGDSFKAIKLKRRCDQLGIRLSMRDVFARKTIATIAAGQIRANGKPKCPPAEEKGATRITTGAHGSYPLMPLDYSWDMVFEALGLQSWNSEAMQRVANVYPCSPMQESIYVAGETKGKHFYRIHALFEVGPSITVDALESAWQSVVDRHESLRTVFVPSTDNRTSRLLDAVVLRTVRCNLERVQCKDFMSILAGYQESCLDPKDFPQGPPHRLTVYCTDDGRHFCLFDQSHMISDGTSLVNTVTELCARAEGSTLDTAPGYSAFIKHAQTEQRLEEGLTYWKSYLSGAQPCNFPLPGITNKLVEGPGAQARCHVVEFPFLRHRELSEFCTRLEITVSTALQAAWALTLRAYTGNDEVCFGYTSSGRDVPLDGVDMICGPLVNLVVRRVRLEDQSLRGMIDAIQRDFADSLPFQAVPFMRVQQLLQSTENKLFNTIMTVQYAPLFAKESSKLPLKLIGNFNASDFALSVQIMYSDTAAKMQLTYSTSLITASMAERVTQNFLSTIEGFLDATNVDGPLGQLGVISPLDRQQVVDWNRETLDGNRKALPCATVHGLIEETAIRNPEMPAIYYLGNTFSYHDLDYMSTRLANRIFGSLGSEQRFIPLLFEKSVLYSVALLAVLKCGKAFVPLDISSPLYRIQGLLEQLGITPSSGLVLCSAGHSDQLRSIFRQTFAPDIEELRAEGNDSASNYISTPFPLVHPSDAAYLIFTSGSTGTPKGVVVSHGAYAHAARTHAAGIGISPEARVLQFASYAFDTSIEDHLTTFVVGACLCVPTETERETALVEFINGSQANWLHITPSTANVIPPASVPSLTTIVLGGEPMTTRNVSDWAIPGRRLIQVYGPSECCVTSTINPDVSVHRDATNIGRALGGCATWVADPNNPNILCPVGAVGELLMEGPILAEGYLGQASATDSAFVSGVVWAPEKRFYRTGDMVQYDEGGNLHFVGRADSRVKIRGQRIECGEIESQLMMQSSVSHAVVVVPKSGPGANHLTSFVSLKTANELTNLSHADDNIQLDSLEAIKFAEITKALNAWLADRLPAYMVPDIIIFVRHVPMNSSRKLDRRRIVDYMEHMSERSYQHLISQMDGPNRDRAGTELERSLKMAWCHVLNVPETTVNWNTSWFSSGGDSISAMILSSDLKKQAISITATDILRLRNIERIASHVEDSANSGLDAKFRNIAITSTVADVPWGLSPIQQLSFQFLPDGDSFDQQTMVVNTLLELSDSTIVAALDTLVSIHPMLLSRFTCNSSDGNRVWTQRVASTPSIGSAYILKFHNEGSTEFKLGCIAETKKAIDIVKGPIVGVDIFRSTVSTTVSISIHHLAVDMVSWRTIFQDFEDFITNQHIMQPEPISFQSWCQVQHVYSQSIQRSRVLPGDRIGTDLGYWSMNKTPNLFGDAITASFDIQRADVANLLGACDKLEYDHVDVLSAAIATSFSKTFSARAPPAIFIEGHGRESPSSSVDLSRTVGWFTTLTPVAVKALPDDKAPNVRMATLQQIKQFREATPSKGLDYFTSRFLQKEGIDAYQEHHAPAEIILNFLGAYQQFERHSSVFKRCDDPDLLSGLSEMRREQRKESKRYALITIVAAVENGTLSVEVEWGRKMAFQNQLASWPLKIKDELLLLIEDLLCLSKQSDKISPAIELEPDFTYFGIDEQKALAEVARLGLLPHEIESMYPCSPMQEGLMASLLRDSDSSSAYNQTFLLKVTPSEGRVVEGAQLEEVWLRMVRKHAILRTIFVESDAGDYTQVVLRHTDPVLLVKRGIDEDELKGTLFESENQSLKAPLSGFTLHRFMVCETPDKSIYILLTKSHLLTDGISTQILMQDIVDGCDGIAEAHWDPQLHYLDYVRYVSSQDADRARRYWATYLSGAGTCSFPRLRYTNDPQATASHSSASLHVYAYELGSIQQLCRAHDLTASNVFMSAWTLVLKAYLNSDSVLFGFLSSGRDLPVTGIQDVVGPVANMLPIRSEIRRDMKVIEVAKSLQADYIEHLSWQTLSLAQMLHAARNGSQSHNFNTILNIQRPEKAEPVSNRKRTQIQLAKWVDTTEYGLALTVAEKKDEYEISLEYDTRLVSPQQADSIVSAFATAVKNMIANPDCLVRDMDLVGDQDRKQIQSWDLSKLQTINECFHDLLQDATNRMPEKEAIYAWDGRITYGELEGLTNRLARTLVSLSVQPGEIITLCFEKSLWGIVAMISVAKAGGLYHAS